MAFSVLPDLKSQTDDVKLLGILKNDGDVPSGAGGSSKTYPEVPIEFRALCGKPESLPVIPMGLGILEGWLGSLSQDHTVLFIHSKNSPCPVVPDFGTKTDSRKKDSLLFAQKVHQFASV